MGVWLHGYFHGCDDTFKSYENIYFRNFPGIFSYTYIIEIRLVRKMTWNTYVNFSSDNQKSRSRNLSEKRGTTWHRSQSNVYMWKLLSHLEGEALVQIISAVQNKSNLYIVSYITLNFPIDFHSSRSFCLFISKHCWF